MANEWVQVQQMAPHSFGYCGKAWVPTKVMRGHIRETRPTTPS